MPRTTRGNPRPARARRRRRVERAAGAAAGLAASLLGSLLPLAGQSNVAHATHEVFSPVVHRGEVELEARGHLDLDHRSARDQASEDELKLGYGVTDFWMLAVEGEWEKEPGEGFNFEETAFQNIFQLTPRGRYPVDLGLFFQYAMADDAGSADDVKFGPILQTGFHRWLVTVNPFFEREVGSDAGGGTAFKYGIQARYRLGPAFEPGIEAFGEPGEIGDFDATAEQTHQLGPGAFGRLSLGRAGVIKYELGVLFGLTRESPDATLKGGLEYEFRF